MRYISNTKVIQVLKLLNRIENLNNKYNLIEIYNNFKKSKFNYNNFVSFDYNNFINLIL